MTNQGGINCDETICKSTAKHCQRHNGHNFGGNHERRYLWTCHCFLSFSERRKSTHLSAWARLKIVSDASICTIPSRPRRSLHSVDNTKKVSCLSFKKDPPEEDILRQAINDIKRTHTIQVTLSKGERTLVLFIYVFTISLCQNHRSGSIRVIAKSLGNRHHLYCSPLISMKVVGSGPCVFRKLMKLPKTCSPMLILYQAS